jgi:hypothetical protein
MSLAERCTESAGCIEDARCIGDARLAAPIGPPARHGVEGGSRWMRLRGPDAAA